MVKYLPNNWKQKLDPSFDELIKIYRDRLSRIHLPQKTGYIFLDDDSCKFLERRGSPPLIGMYETFNLDTLSELAKTGVNKNLEYIASPSKDMNKLILELAKTLPDKSKAFYLQKLEPDLPKEEAFARLKGKSKEEIQELRNELQVDYKALIFHAVSIGYWDLKNDTGVKVKANVDLELLISISLSQVYDGISLLTHKKPLKLLVEEARNGNDSSLFNAIQIDKALFDFDWVRKKIRQAMLSGDYEFFDKLGQAIKAPPLENDIEYGELHLVLKFFWNMGLCRLTITELIELLGAGGLALQDDPEALKKLIYRLRKEGFLTS